MKTAISLPDELFDAADDLARRLGLSRSALYARALREYLARHRDRRVTERLDQVYGASPEGLDPTLRSAQARSVGHDDEAW